MLLQNTHELPACCRRRIYVRTSFRASDLALNVANDPPKVGLALSVLPSIADDVQGDVHNGQRHMLYQGDDRMGSLGSDHVTGAVMPFR